MADKFYLANRLKYHTASRVAYKPKDPLAETFNVDGHTVVVSKIWSAKSQEFAYQTNPNVTEPNLATKDLIKVFKTLTYTAIPTGTVLPADSIYYTNINNTYESAKTETEITVTETNKYFTCDVISAAFNNTTDASKGIVWTNALYPAVRLYENVELKAITDSQGPAGDRIK